MSKALLDSMRLAVAAFVAHPMRTLLTLLGIVIGISTVMTMMALMSGLQEKVTNDFSQLGANVFRVDIRPQGIHLGGGGGIDRNLIAKRPPLVLADMEAIAERCPSVLRTAAVSWQPGQRVRTATQETGSGVFVLGATSDYSETSGIDISEGRFINRSEDLDGSRVAVIGPDIAERLFPGTVALGQQIRISRGIFQVVGVMGRRGKLLGKFNLDNQVAIPITSFLSLYGKKRSISISVEAKSKEALGQAIEETTRVMRQRRNVAPTADNNFEVSTNETMAKQLMDMSRIVTAATFGICLISLFVGGIGVMNIMLVSVTERTREIGVRKALGARRGRILMQFTMEAAVLGIMGGVIGIATGYGLAFLGKWAFGLYTSVPLWAVLVSLIMSLAVGLVFGVYPASRAARLNPVDAMRAE